MVLLVQQGGFTEDVVSNLLAESGPPRGVPASTVAVAPSADAVDFSEFDLTDEEDLPEIQEDAEPTQAQGCAETLDHLVYTRLNIITTREHAPTQTFISCIPNAAHLVSAGYSGLEHLLHTFFRSCAFHKPP